MGIGCSIIRKEISYDWESARTLYTTYQVDTCLVADTEGDVYLVSIRGRELLSKLRVHGVEALHENQVIIAYDPRGSEPLVSTLTITRVGKDLIFSDPQHSASLLVKAEDRKPFIPTGHPIIDRLAVVMLAPGGEG